jgi:hypothetical protein
MLVKREGKAKIIIKFVGHPSLTDCGRSTFQGSGIYGLSTTFSHILLLQHIQDRLSTGRFFGNKVFNRGRASTLLPAKCEEMKVSRKLAD